MHEHAPRIQRAERVRNTIPETTVPLYQFTIDEPIDFNDVPGLAAKAREYMRLRSIISKDRAKHYRSKTKTSAEAQRLSELDRELTRYFSRRAQLRHKSILSASIRRENGIDSGGDVRVLSYGHPDSWLAQHWVCKYSHKRNITGPEVEYLQKKYAVLRLLMKEHIPEAVVIWGEYRGGTFNKDDPFKPLPLQRRAITLQRRIHGKTMKDMTPDERRRPEVREALKKALAVYIDAASTLDKVALLRDKMPGTLKLGLDIGLSSDSQDAIKNANLNELTSPNLMYDDKTQTIYFIDLGEGFWDTGMEAIYTELQRTH